LYIEALEDRNVPAAVSWTGNGGDFLWQTAANWSNDAVPGSADDVTINAPGVTISHSTSSTVHDFTLSAGTIAGGDFTVNGLFGWSGGTLMNGSLTAQGGISLGGGTLDGYTLNNPGVATWTAGNIVTRDGAVFNNEASGTLDIQADGLTLGPPPFSVADPLYAGALCTFNNAGLLKKSAGSTINSSPDIRGVAIHSSGTIDVEQGGLSLGYYDVSGDYSGPIRGNFVEFVGPSDFSAAASIDAASVHFHGADATLAGSYQAGSTTIESGQATFTGAVAGLGDLTIVQGGTADLSGASLSAAGRTLPSLYLNGTLRAAGNFVVSGACHLDGRLDAAGGVASLTPQAGMTLGGLTLDGFTLVNPAGQTATWSNGTITVTDGGGVNNGPGATFGSAGNTSILALNGGTLAGSGTVNANVSNNGQVAPTAGGGSMILIGNYVQGSGGTLGIGLAGTAAGTGYSQLVVNGGVSLNGSLAVSLSFQSAVGDQFAILHDGGSAAIDGTFAGGSVILVNGQRFQISYGSYVSGTGQDVVLTHLNTPPTLASVTVTSPINEGSTATLTGNIVDPDPLDTHTLVVNWGDGSSAQTFTFGAGALPFTLSHRYVNNPPGQPNGSFPITVTVTDAPGASGTGSTSVQVNNVAPTVGAITAPLAPVQVGTAISTSASFTDPGVLDTHTAVWSWGDNTTSAGTVTEANGSGSVAGSHTYAADGVYTVTLTVTDQDGGVGTSVFQYVVMYNPSAGFVTGGGWITSPAGAYAANPNLTGRANFGLNARYQAGATVPTGSTEFQFPAANLNFHATSYDWLVITTSQAQYQGSGTINGAGSYGFLVTALDGGGQGAGMFRLMIWDKNNNNAVAYDTQPGAAVSAAPTTPLGGGRIQVHTNAQLAAGVTNPTGGDVAPLTPEELRPVVQEAIARWAAAGIDAGRLRALSQVTVGVAEFPGPWLGMAFPGAIWIDRDAAGYGWYVDPTPADDGEFPAEPGSPAYGKVDLLTVVEHELGHELGFDDTPGGGLMGLLLPTGTRRLPEALGGPEGKFLPGASTLSPTASSSEISTLAPNTALLRLFAVPLSSAAVGMASDAPLPGPGQNTPIGGATATGPGVWSLTFGPSGLKLAAGKSTLFAQAEDGSGVFDDPFALILEAQ
jgi:hypothetical protein